MAFWNSVRGKTDGNKVKGTTVNESTEYWIFDRIPPPKINIGINKQIVDVNQFEKNYHS